MMTARDIMTKEVVTVTSETSLKELAKIFVEIYVHSDKCFNIGWVHVIETP